MEAWSGRKSFGKRPTRLRTGSSGRSSPVATPTVRRGRSPGRSCITMTPTSSRSSTARRPSGRTLRRGSAGPRDGRRITAPTASWTDTAKRREVSRTAPRPRTVTPTAGRKSGARSGTARADASSGRIPGPAETTPRAAWRTPPPGPGARSGRRNGATTTTRTAAPVSGRVSPGTSSAATTRSARGVRSTTPTAGFTSTETPTTDRSTGTSGATAPGGGGRRRRRSGGTRPSGTPRRS